MRLPHAYSAQADRWKAVHFASWCGGVSTPSVPGREASQTPGVHLTRPGSNLCLSGFETPDEARDYRDRFGSQDWRIMDLRPERPALTQTALYMQRRLRISEIYEGWDFGEFVVEGQSGWEHDGRDRFSRHVFFDTGAEDSLAIAFAIEFHPGSSSERLIEFDHDRLPEDMSPGF